MLRKEKPRSYQEFRDEDDEKDERDSPDFLHDVIEDLEKKEPDDSAKEEDVKESNQSMRVSKTCLKNVFTVVLIFIYLLLTAVAGFLAYQTITDFLEKLKNPVMSVIYKEVDMYMPAGIALYPDNAQLLSCTHHFHDYIPPLVDPGKLQEGDCVIDEVTYSGPFNPETKKKALVVRGPSDVSQKELIFIQLSQNETEENFSAISYMLFAKFSDFRDSANKSAFMRECEKKYSMYTFSGGFRTWVKMSLVTSSGKVNETNEFKQESSVVKFNDMRPQAEKSNQLFYVVFQWRDHFIQDITLIVTANAWNSVGILCGIFMALFKAANFANLSIAWIIRMRKRHLRTKAQELNQITEN